MRILIADDDPLVTDALSHYCRKVDAQAELTVVRDGRSALQAMNAGSPDLLLVDLEMPALNGRELLKLIDPGVPVLIITSDRDFAVEAFHFNVVDYLVKPVSFDRFATAWRKVMDRAAKDGSPVPAESVFVRAGADIVRIDLRDVRFIKSESNYVRFVLDGKEITSLMNLKDLEHRLPASFVRVHRSYIVNLRHIEKLDSMDIKIGRDLVPISGTYRTELLKRIDPL